MADGVSVYPRTYQYGLKGRLIWSLFSLLFLMPGLGGMALFTVAAVKSDWVPFLKLANQATIAWYFVGLCALLALLGLFCLISTLRGKLVLYKDWLEYTGVWSPRIVRREQIVETRNVRRKYGFLMLTLVLKTPKVIKITICDFGKADDLLVQWFDDIPNAEDRAQQARNEALFGNPVFGATEEAREQAINGQIKVINILGYAAQGAGLWGFIYPRPYDVCMAILAGIPVLAFLAVLLSGGRWALTEDKLSGRISLANLLYLPVVALGLRAFLDDQLIAWQPPLICAGIATPCLLAAAAAVERRFNIKNAWSAAFLYFAYAWGILVHVNNLLDIADPSVTKARILDMSVSSGRTTTYYLELPPWGPYAKPDEYSVNRDLYDHVHKGDTVCIYVYPGALGWADYVIDDCPANKP